MVEGSGLRHLLTYCEDGRACEPNCLFFACRTALRCQECPKAPMRVLFHSYGHYETLLPECWHCFTPTCPCLTHLLPT